MTTSKGIRPGREEKHLGTLLWRSTTDTCSHNSCTMATEIWERGSSCKIRTGNYMYMYFGNRDSQTGNIRYHEYIDNRTITSAII